MENTLIENMPESKIRNLPQQRAGKKSQLTNYLFNDTFCGSPATTTAQHNEPQHGIESCENFLFQFIYFRGAKRASYRSRSSLLPLNSELCKF